jgi:hypothetical protein
MFQTSIANVHTRQGLINNPANSFPLTYKLGKVLLHTKYIIYNSHMHNIKR